MFTFDSARFGRGRRGGPFLALLIATLLVPSADAAEAWTRCAQGDSRIKKLVAAPSDPARVYAVQDNGKWMRTGDAGVTWKSFQSPRIRDVAVDPLNSDRLYVSTDPPGLYMSDDAGDSFTLLLDLFAGAIGIDPNNPLTIYVGLIPYCGNDTCWRPPGVLKTTDGGMTWRETARTDSGAGPIIIDPNDSNVVWTIGYGMPLNRRVAGLYRSTDGGVTWPPLQDGYMEIEALAVDTLSRVYDVQRVRFESPLFRSADQGRTWTWLRNPHEANISFNGVLTDPRNPASVFLAVYPVSVTPVPGVMVSHDDGTTWRAVGGTFPELSGASAIALTAEGRLLAGGYKGGIYRLVEVGPKRRAVRP